MCVDMCVSELCLLCRLYQMSKESKLPMPAMNIHDSVVKVKTSTYSILTPPISSSFRPNSIISTAVERVSLTGREGGRDTHTACLHVLFLFVQFEENYGYHVWRKGRMCVRIW